MESTILYVRCVSLVALLGIVTLFWDNSCQRVHAQAVITNAKGEKGKVTPEIARMIQDLGSNVVATRQIAETRLKATPYVLKHLRDALGSDSLTLEHRRRLESVLHARRQVVFKKHFKALTSEKDKAPMDLLVDMLLEHRQHVNNEEWAEVSMVLDSLIRKLSGPIKDAPLPLKGFDFRVCQQIIGKNIFLEEPLCFRLIADRLEAGGTEGGSIAVLSTPATTGYGHFNNALLMRGGPLKTGDPQIKVGGVTGCFVFTSGDFVCDRTFASIVIAGGNIRICNPENSVIIPKARLKSAVSWFSAKHYGFVPSMKRGRLVIEKVLPGSTASQCRFQAGDEIQYSCDEASAIMDFENCLRRNYSRQQDIELTVIREGRAKTLSLQFPE